MVLFDVVGIFRILQRDLCSLVLDTALVLAFFFVFVGFNVWRESDQ